METAVLDKPNNDRPIFEIDLPKYNIRKGTRYIDLNEFAWVITFVGHRGGGKTLGMTYFAAREMVKNNRQVLSNYKIEFKSLTPYGEIKIHQSLPLDMSTIYAMDESLSNYLILIDEAEVYFDSRSSMSTKNRIFSYLVSQIRKRKMSLFMTTQNDNEIDGRLRDKTDVFVVCRDAKDKYPEADRGKTILMDYYDNSGLFTGDRYNPLTHPQGHDQWVLHNANKIWGLYQTNETIDVFEPNRQIKIDMNPLKITDKQQGNDIKQDIIENAQSLLNNGAKAVDDEDWWKSLDVEDQGLRVTYGRMMSALGIEKKRSRHGGYEYRLGKLKV